MPSYDELCERYGRPVVDGAMRSRGALMRNIFETTCSSGPFYTPMTNGEAEKMFNEIATGLALAHGGRNDNA